MDARFALSLLFGQIVFGLSFRANLYTSDYRAGRSRLSAGFFRSKRFLASVQALDRLFSE
jgi:hypothetical protein